MHGPSSTWPAAAGAGRGQEGVGSAPLGDFGGLSKQGLGVTSDQDTGCWLRMDSGVTRTESAREEVRLRLGVAASAAGQAVELESRASDICYFQVGFEREGGGAEGWCLGEGEGQVRAGQAGQRPRW